MKSRLLTVSQAAKLKGVTRKAIYDAIEREDLTAQVETIQRVRIREEDLADYKPRGPNKKGKTNLTI